MIHRCPKCGSPDLTIMVSTTARLYQDGAIRMDLNTFPRHVSTAADPEAAVVCNDPDCEHGGLLEEFQDPDQSCDQVATRPCEHNVVALRP